MSKQKVATSKVLNAYQVHISLYTILGFASSLSSIARMFRLRFSYMIVAPGQIEWLKV
jgi:hypothetical protein